VDLIRDSVKDQLNGLNKSVHVQRTGESKENCPVFYQNNAHGTGMLHSHSKKVKVLIPISVSLQQSNTICQDKQAKKGSESESVSHSQPHIIRSSAQDLIQVLKVPIKVLEIN